MKIIIENLSKIFKDGTQALTDVNLIIENGIFGLVGPNASGKTTLIRILATLEKPTSGKVTFDGMDMEKNRAAVRSMTDYLPQKFSTFAKMTTWEFLDYSARLAGLHDKTKREQSMDELLYTLDLHEVRNRNANELSTAMKRHLEIAQAVIGNPRVLIVDEPTAGLAPEERLRFRSLLTERSAKIEIIIFSTHIHKDITASCTNMAILEKGEVTCQGSPELCLKS